VSLTVGAIIADARLRHPLFDPARIPLPVALALLDGYVRRLRAELLSRAPDRLAVQQDVPLPLTDFEQGYPMPPYVTVLDVTAWVTVNGQSRGELVAVIPYQQRYDAGVWPAAYLVRDGLYLKGSADEWSAFGKLVVTYTPDDEDLTALTQVISLAPMFKSALVENLASLMAIRVSDQMGAAAYQAIAGIASQAEQQAFQKVVLQRRQERWITKEY
jgi:hypothetical protein